MVLLTSTLAALDTTLLHWFVLPVALCGLLVGVDALDWLRRRRDVFDPQGLVGLAGFHVFYLAPLLHVMLDRWAPASGMLHPHDWREALGRMAVVNLIGLLAYRVVLSYRGRGRTAAPRGGRGFTIRFDERRFHRAGLLMAAIGVAAFVAEIELLGGVSGFVTAMTEDRELLRGTGWLLVIAESFPFTLFTVAAIRWRAALRRRPALAVTLLVAMAVVQFTIGGLRGSRGSTLFAVVLGLILVHFLAVRITRKALTVFAVFFFAFMYIYGIYKNAGLEVLQVGEGTRTVAELEEQTGRDLATILLLDLGRADVQAVVLDRTLRGEGKLAWGETYVSGALLPVSGLLVERKPQAKLYYGSVMLRGDGSYDGDTRQWSSHIYGLAGEAILNFGPLAGPLAFVPFAFAIRGARRLYARARGGNVLAAAVGAPLCLAAVLWMGMDTDNIVYFLLLRLAPVAIAVLLSLSVVAGRRDGVTSDGLAG